MGVSIITYTAMSISGNPIHNMIALIPCNIYEDVCGPALFHRIDQLYGWDKPIYLQWWSLCFPMNFKGGHLQTWNCEQRKTFCVFN